MKYFKISGYWKDDKSEFTDYIVKDTDDAEKSDIDNNIFYYGLTENKIKDAIKKKEDTIHEFVITSYKKV